MEVIPLFVGHDVREAVGSVVFAQSVHEHATCPVAITRLGNGEVERDGTNAFTYRRFLVPFLMGFEGFAIFVDGVDCLMRADIAELVAFFDPYFAVRVVKHDYRTCDALKYRGTPMQTANDDYPRKNWSSVVVWNCAHPFNVMLTPDFIALHSGEYLHQFRWLQDHRIGDLPHEWNVLIGETGDGDIDAKIAHYTLGIPGFARYRNARYADEWHATLQRAMHGLQERSLCEGFR